MEWVGVEGGRNQKEGKKEEGGALGDRIMIGGEDMMGRESGELEG